MKVLINGNVVLVKLSRTNLLSLLHKLDVPNSGRVLCRNCEDDLDLVVKAEEDEEHYEDRARGQMSDETEDFLNDQRRTPAAA